MDWDTRYSGSDFLFGTAPADFLVREAPRIPKDARVLCVADGEGRNGVHLARLGHRVTTFDFSANAVSKARGLAEEAGVTVEMNVSTMQDWDWSRKFDALVAVFIQFLDPEARAQAFARFADALRPGGLLLLHGYAPRQVGYGTGGPGAVENMYTEALLAEAFAGWEVLLSADYDAEIHEGAGHSGRSALVDFVAVRPGG
ncbi:class I SAM-dependent methyltransferase [Roseibacterium sp. SDUM158017]|uniref:SAM-dependent methyltransferase n=1 Tax=Roseicyclus salinarum TaxID=3036773 RepID=UPI0024157BEA|nr:class I SAM-dependent methyltransferase [Roseibacterium sp. SDUM158017]MDG4648000.1 class I SAM-dependent methyltransferase [Roseibacterium sp. SDUM158017]